MTTIDEKQIAELQARIERAKRIVFFGGAGVSTESGIPDFRSGDGVFKAIEAFGYPPETLISHDFFLRDTETFYRYYRKFLLAPDALPNDAHAALTLLEEQGKLSAIVTQNIDNLHQAAGSRHVLELHGSVHRNYCMRCRKFYSLSDILAMDNVPRCTCGGIIKPDVVLYGEGLDERVISESIEEISRADMLIIGGTSLVVYPAAGLADYFRGDNLVVINLSKTGREGRNALTVHAPIGQVLRQAVLAKRDPS